VINVAVAVPETPDDSARPWPRWQRIVFRYLLCHCLLYCLPEPLDALLRTMSRGFLWLHDKLESAWLMDAARWCGTAAMHVFRTPREWWDTVILGLTDSHWTPFPAVDLVNTLPDGTQQRMVNPSGSGDTSAEITRLLVIVAVSLLVTVVWSLLSRARGYPRLGRWLHLYARWYLAFEMLFSYGLMKLYGGQFGSMELGRLTQEYGDKSGMGMVWTFMAGSRAYEWFGGLGEVIGGALLLHHRTALLGALVTIGVMANVCALNWLYDVPVKLFSLHLLLIAVFLLAPYRERLWALLIANRVSLPVDMRVVRRWWLVWPLMLFGFAWIGCQLVTSHVDGMKAIARNEQRLGPRPELWGIWRVEKLLRGGVEVPITDATRWQFLALDRGPRAWVKEATGRTHSWRLAEELAADGKSGTLTLTDQAGSAFPLAIERGTKLVPTMNPAPLRMDDFRKMVDVDTPTLVLKGKLGEHEVEVHTVKRYFPLLRRFTMVQEMPYNR
jgi:hypothetical protein